MEDNQIQTNEQSNYEKIITIDIEKEMIHDRRGRFL